MYVASMHTLARPGVAIVRNRTVAWDILIYFMACSERISEVNAYFFDQADKRFIVCVGRM